MNGIRVIGIGLFICVVCLCITAAADTVILYPMANGDHIGLGTTFLPNYVAVNQTNYIVYNSWLATWKYDVYTLTNPSASGIITNVTVYTQCYRNSGGTSNSAGNVKIDGVIYNSTTHALSTVDQYFYDYWTTNPGTSEAWTWDNMTDLQAGISLNFLTGTGRPNCRRVYVIVNYIDAYTSVDDPINVEETTATLQGTLNYTATTATCGFWYGTTSPVTELNADGNVTCTGTYGEGESFSKAVSGLTSAEYYYVRSWSLDDTFHNSSNEATFLTKPNQPTNLAVTDIDGSDVTLSWTQATVAGGTNRRTIIVYKTGTYPTSVSDGTIGYNASGVGTVLSLPQGGTTYYISAFTYINATGSPYYWHFSDGYDYESAATEGGNYTIYIRYENNSELVNLSQQWNNSGVWEDMVHRFRAYNSDNELVYQAYPDNETGMFDCFTDEAFAKVSFYYNMTCYRVLTVEEGQQNITFFISGASQGLYVGNLANIVIYFEDYSGLLTLDNHPYGYIYTFNETGRITLHEDELQADNSIRTDLVIGETYRVGVGCDVFVLDDLRVLTITQNEFTITIEVMVTSSESNASSTWFQILDIDTGYVGNTLFVQCEDLSHSGDEGVQNATISLYYASNDTLIESVDASGYGLPWLFNYTKTVNTEYMYYVIVNVVYETDEESWEKNVFLWFLPIASSYVYNPDIDDILNNTIGQSPMYYQDDTGTHMISWGATIVLFLAMIPLFMFGRQYAGIGIIGCGTTLMFFNLYIHLVTIQNSLVTGFIIMFGVLVHFAIARDG